MLDRSNVFLCAGLKGALYHRDTIVSEPLNLEVQHFVSARALDDDPDSAVRLLLDLKSSLSLRLAFHAPFMQVNYFSLNSARAADSLRTLITSFDLPGALRAAASLPHAVSLGIECRLHPRPNLTKSLVFLSPFLPTP